jgi:hypothetical protein
MPKGKYQRKRKEKDPVVILEDPTGAQTPLRSSAVRAIWNKMKALVQGPWRVFAAKKKVVKRVELVPGRDITDEFDE